MFVFVCVCPCERVPFSFHLQREIPNEAKINIDSIDFDGIGDSAEEVRTLKCTKCVQVFGCSVSVCVRNK